ncbi:hypothetical protein KUTeg_016674 [Tegillarca granosa]|uniref:EF-hand domain-containing protein n=1 Tax=Tegillarca granosa TaxID=220873 RepID=A0ABQ9ELM4_TEGGR|nr:hypothetical protein KUTeg_016674 [Tegillarca granosa]
MKCLCITNEVFIFLLTVLQQAGRNPSSNAIKKYWSSRTDCLTFDDFVDICRKEPETTEDEMMTAFRKIDINGDGYLSLDELYKIMSTKGEKMSREEVKKMIDEVDENGDGKLDYKESIIRDDKFLYEKFCKMVISTARDCKKASIKIMEKKERKRKKEQQNYVEASLRKDESDLGSQISVKSSSSDISSTAKMGSQQSLQSQSREETSEKKTGSMISVRSASGNKKDDSKESDKDSEHENDKPDDADQDGKKEKRKKHKNKKSDDEMGSTTTLKSEPMGSSTTLKSENMGSRVSLKTASKLSSRRQSQTSVASQSASRISLREEEKKESDKDSEHEDEKPDDNNDDDEKKVKQSPRKKRKNKKSDDDLGSTTSLKSETMGSTTTLKSETMGSTATLKSETMGSKVSLKSESKLSSRRQSKASVASQSASRVSLKGEEKSESISGSRASLVSAGMFGSRRSMLSIDDLPRPSPRSKKDRPRGGAAAKLDNFLNQEILSHGLTNPLKVVSSLKMTV